MILADTNILLRLAQSDHPHHSSARDAVRLLTTRDREQFCIAPQTIYEMYVVCTRPVSQNGLGLNAARARVEIARMRSIFALVGETEEVFSRWESLTTTYAVEGKSAHDTHLVAFMLVNRIGRLLSFNDAHFMRYVEISALNPFHVLGIARQ